MTGNIWVVLPLVWLIGGAFVLGLIGRLWRPSNALLAGLTALICISGLALLVPSFTLARSALSADAPLPTWGGAPSGSVLLEATPGALVLTALALGLGLFTAVYSGHYMSRDNRYPTSYPLLLLMLSGLLGMLLTTDLFNLYLFCELMSISAYVLVAFRRHTDTSIEAGFKYLILGSVATLTMLLGVAWIYREAGSVALPLTEGMQGRWTRLGTACFLVGLALKSGIVPLHTWLPDAYGRAPSSISALLASVISKSTLLVLLKVTLGLGFPAEDLGLLLILFSFLNMTLGNALALVQRNTKRLLAYSSIAQTGYVMFALGIGLHYDLPAALNAGFFLLLVHAFLKALAFLSKGVCHFYCDTTQVEELRGTAHQLPLVAITFSVALAGLAGIPPLAGFPAKWFILAESLLAQETLAYVGVGLFLLNSVLALGYYLPLIVRLFIAPAEEDAERLRISPWMGVPLLLLGALALTIGLQPTPWLESATWLTFFIG
jgi:proton-translocating NADH-quinone oxidoreductase chain N